MLKRPDEAEAVATRAKAMLTRLETAAKAR